MLVYQRVSHKYIPIKPHSHAPIEIQEAVPGRVAHAPVQNLGRGNHRYTYAPRRFAAICWDGISMISICLYCITMFNYSNKVDFT